MRRKLVHNFSRCGGLTLTEVVVASSLLAIAMIPMLRGLTAGTMTSTAVERKTQSLILAQGKMEEIRAICGFDYTVSFGQSDLSLGGSYYCDVTDTPSGSDLRKIEVTVGFDADGDGNLDADEKDAVLTTKMARRD